MKDFENYSAIISQQPARTNSLRKTIISAASMMLVLAFLSSCSKDAPSTGGGLGATPTQWYVLRVTNADPKNPGKVGFLAGISTDPLFSFYDYMQISASGWKFKIVPGTNGFNYWQMTDSNYLSLRYNGWAYRSTASNRVGWKIVNGKLTTDYARWKEYPLGAEFRSDLDLIPAAYYVGADLANGNEFNCELVAAP